MYQTKDNFLGTPALNSVDNLDDGQDNCCCYGQQLFSQACNGSHPISTEASEPRSETPASAPAPSPAAAQSAAPEG